MASRIVIACAGLLLAAPALAMADTAKFNIPAQPLGAALRAFADQAKMQLLYESGAVGDAIGSAVTGEMEKRDALEILLRDTGLEAVYSSEDAATIRPSRSPAPGNHNTSGVGDSIDMMGRSFQIVGTSSDTFMTSFVFMTHTSTDSILGVPGTTSLILVVTHDRETLRA